MHGEFSPPQLKVLGDLVDELVFVWTVSGDLLWARGESGGNIDVELTDVVLDAERLPLCIGSFIVNWRPLATESNRYVHRTSE